MLRRRVLRSVVGVACLALAGCGSGNNVWVTGHLLKGGQPYQAPDRQTIGVTFYAMETKGNDGKNAPANEPYAATYNSDGSFEVPGKEGRGIPPGMYRISVIRKPKAGKIAPIPKGSKAQIDRDKDYLNDQFGPETSPIVREIPASVDLTIDLDNPAQ